MVGPAWSGSGQVGRLTRLGQVSFMAGVGRRAHHRPQEGSHVCEGIHICIWAYLHYTLYMCVTIIA